MPSAVHAVVVVTFSLPVKLLSVTFADLSVYVDLYSTVSSEPVIAISGLVVSSTVTVLIADSVFPDVSFAM